MPRRWVDGGEFVDDLVAGGDDAVEQATRVDRRELLRVTDQHQLPVASFDLFGEPGQVGGGDHGGLINDHHAAVLEFLTAGVEVVAQHGDGPGPPVPEILPHFPGGGGGGDPDHRVANALCGVGVGTDRIGLAGATRAHHRDEPAIEGREVTHRRLLLGNESPLSYCFLEGVPIDLHRAGSVHASKYLVLSLELAAGGVAGLAGKRPQPDRAVLVNPAEPRSAKAAGSCAESSTPWGRMSPDSA